MIRVREQAYKHRRGGLILAQDLRPQGFHLLFCPRTRLAGTLALQRDPPHSLEVVFWRASVPASRVGNG
jgi:hypothetical protein